MPNLSTILKGEITRLARKEIKAAVDPVRKANAGHRREIAELKRKAERADELERERMSDQEKAVAEAKDAARKEAEAFNQTFAQALQVWNREPRAAAACMPVEAIIERVCLHHLHRPHLRVEHLGVKVAGHGGGRQQADEQ